MWNKLRWNSGYICRAKINTCTSIGHSIQINQPPNVDNGLLDLSNGLWRNLLQPLLDYHRIDLNVFATFMYVSRLLYRIHNVDYVKSSFINELEENPVLQNDNAKQLSASDIENCRSHFRIQYIRVCSNVCPYWWVCGIVGMNCAVCGDCTTWVENIP